jgi:hypothetical protein
VIKAAERNNERRMRVSDKSALRRVSEWAAVDVGEMEARALLNSIELPIDAQVAQILAA